MDGWNTTGFLLGWPIFRKKPSIFFEWRPRFREAAVTTCALTKIPTSLFDWFRTQILITNHLSKRSKPL